MRIAVFSDLHIHAFREFASYADGSNSRQREIAARLLDTLNLAVDEEADAIVFAGDFYDNKSHIEVSSFFHAKRIFEEWSENHEGYIPVVMCSGTHDIGRNQCSTLLSLEKVLNLMYIDRQLPGTFPIIPIPSAVGGENHRQKILEGIRGIRKDILDRTILVTHGFVGGAHFSVPVVSDDMLDERFLLDNFKLSIVGHYHNPSRHFYYDEKRKRGILIPGAIIPHDFGNPNLGKAWLVDVDEDSGDIQVDERAWEHPKFVTVDLSIPANRTYQFNSMDYYRVYVPSDLEPTLPANARVLVIQRNVIEARMRNTGITIGDPPEQLATKYVLFKASEDVASLPLEAGVLSRIGRIIAKSKDRELSDTDTEKIEELFDGAN